MPAILKGKGPWVALGLTALVFVASLALRPMWRDEIWAIYFSGLGKPLPEVLEAIERDVHPPLYFVLLHYWRLICEDPLWVRVFNVAVIACGAGGAWLLRGARKAETLTFLFLCATSYWVLFYGVEARMMVLEFVLCALSVLVVRNTLDRDIAWGRGAFLFFGLGVFAASAHYFGALWVAMLGASAGLTLLKRGKVGAFLGWGVASAAAIAPVCLWIVWAHPEASAGAPGRDPNIGAALATATNQFSRGLLVKTLFCNVAATAAAVLSLGRLVQRRDGFLLTLLAAATGTVAIAFLIHVLFVPMIKERAFIVMMPAVIYLIAEALHAADRERKGVSALINAIPLAAILALPLFSVEYFKDRERVGEVRALIAAHAEACAGAPIVVHYRPSAQAADFSEFFTQTALAGAGGGSDVTLVDAATLAGTPPTRCPVKALTMILPRGEGVEQAEARAALRAAGLDLEALQEVRIGRGRTLVYVAR